MAQGAELLPSVAHFLGDVPMTPGGCGWGRALGKSDPHPQAVRFFADQPDVQRIRPLLTSSGLPLFISRRSPLRGDRQPEICNISTRREIKSRGAVLPGRAPAR